MAWFWGEDQLVSKHCAFALGEVGVLDVLGQEPMQRNRHTWVSGGVS